VMLGTCLVLLLLILRMISRSERSSIAPHLNSFEKGHGRAERIGREEIGRDGAESANAVTEQHLELIGGLPRFLDPVVMREPLHCPSSRCQAA
jgi:hypothetical protein